MVYQFNNTPLLLKPIEFHIKLDIHVVKSRWSIVYNEGSQVIVMQTHNEMQHYVAFHLGLQCLPNNIFRGIRVHKGLKKDK